MSSIASSCGKNKPQEGTPVLVLRLNGHVIKVTAEDLRSDETADRLRQDVVIAPDTVDVSLAHLLKASHEDRFPAIDLLVSLNANCTFHGEQ